MTSRSNLRHLRWSPGQMLAHLASSGCGLQTGELFGTGTISSPVCNTLKTLPSYVANLRISSIE